MEDGVVATAEAAFGGREEGEEVLAEEGVDVPLFLIFFFFG